MGRYRRLLERSLLLLESVSPPLAVPEPETELEGALFDALTIVFIHPRGADRARLAIAHAMGEPTFEMLVAFLAFVRMAHFWTETHPTLDYESDMVELMRSTSGALRFSEERLRALVVATRDMLLVS